MRKKKNGPGRVYIQRTKDYYRVNGRVDYADVDSALQYARKKQPTPAVRIFVRPDLILMTRYKKGYRITTLALEKTETELAWPVFESYVRML